MRALLLAAMLGVRGIGSIEEAESFLDGGAELLRDPMLLKDMDKAVERIKKRHCPARDGRRLRRLRR